MLSLTATQLWVHDQDEALSFWTGKVGLEVKEDVTVPELGNFRWLAVGPKGQDGTTIVLMAIPGQPVMDDATRAKVAELTAMGFAGAMFFEVADAYAMYDELVANGVEVTDKPTQQPYGIDFGFRDPSGNTVRVTQRTPMG